MQMHDGTWDIHRYRVIELDIAPIRDSVEDLEGRIIQIIATERFERSDVYRLIVVAAGR